MKFRVGLAVLVAMVASAAAGSAAAPAGAALTCGGESKQPFLPWLDPIDYGLADGGSLESTSGWTLAGGAKRAAGNEPFYVNSTADSFSLALPAGKVDLLYETSKGKVRTIGGISAIDGLVHTSWAPTLPVVIALDTLVRDLLVLDVNATEVAFRFRASSGLLTSASWRIDDLYVDPWADKLGW